VQGRASASARLAVPEGWSSATQFGFKNARSL